MNYFIEDGGLVPPQDCYISEGSSKVNVYLLERKLLRILKNEVSREDYSQLTNTLKTGNDKLVLAIEERPYQLNAQQLRFALSMYENEGRLKLIQFLLKPVIKHWLSKENPVGSNISEWATREEMPSATHQLGQSASSQPGTPATDQTPTADPAYLPGETGEEPLFHLWDFTGPAKTPDPDWFSAINPQPGSHEPG